MKPEKPNLDLINMVQRARMQHDSAAKPSEVSAIYWIEAKDLSGKAAPPTPRSGEWVMRVPLGEVDHLWERIKTATESGALGYKSKVSTAARTEDRAKDTRLICVRTHDADDTADITRVRDALREMGFTPSQYRRDTE